MFFNLLNELILRDTTDGHLYQYVYGEEKEAIARKLNGQIEQQKRDHNIALHHRNAENNTVEEALNRAPMFLNAIKNRGYKNILFVGHVNQHQSAWVVPHDLDRIVDVLPPERSKHTSIVDHNIVLQFLPLVMKMYGYKGEFSYTSPDENRFRGLIHTLYDLNGLRPHMVKTVGQYRHGISAEELQLGLDPAERYDAVVFLGVPKLNEEDFTAEQVREVFAPYCTEDFEMVDLWYSVSGKGRFEGAEEKDNSVDLDVAWTTRAQWEENFQGEGGRPEELEIFKRMMSIY